ncbi:RiPP maturation radical SAM C-methyltransferase [Nonomuraea sp. NPDC002799]
MRIVLINMPWAPVDVPSLALGILTTCARGRFPDADVRVVNANLDYVNWLVERGEFTLPDYQFYAQDSYFLGCGDWVFSSALYDDPGWREAEFTESMRPIIPQERIEASMRLHRSAPDFIEHLARQVAELDPDVVGLTSTFQQNSAGLALARRLKSLAPRATTVFGGANCDGPQGAALHRNFPFVDYVVRGEGEVAFADLLTLLREGGDPRDIAGLCWRAPGGDPVANEMSATPLPPAAIMSPDYDDFFRQFPASRAYGWTEPKLVVESSRGCWWGQKHHCTFCGLNGSLMTFRSKNPSTFLDEILALARRHRVLDMIVVDNIMDMAYVTSLLPRIVEADVDIRLHYEIKSNMRAEQLDMLRAAGVIRVQPGIENLSTRVLKLMDKGVTGCQNVRMLRDAQTSGLTVAWNYLHGFPGERTEDYLGALAQMSALHHLGPPDGVGPVVLERFSPYFNDPGLGFATRSPAEQYRVTYALPDAELADFAYLFDTPEQGIGEDVAERLRAAVRRWREAYPASRLTCDDLGDAIVLVSERAGFDWTVMRLSDEVEIAAFRLLEQPRRVPALAARLRVPQARVIELVRAWLALGILFTEDDQYVHLAPRSANQSLLHTV